MSTKSHDEYLGERRFKTLDGLRALSILLVFTAHPADQAFWGIFHGGTGVTLFFVLSGFLITTLLLREEEKYGRVSFSAFYIRRVFRIYPLYFLVFAFYCFLILVIDFVPARRDAFIENIPYFLLFFPEHAHILRTGVAVPFDGTWSIGIEEKFYLVWPALAFGLLVHRRWLRPAVISVLALVFAGASFFPGWPEFLAPYAHIAFGALAALGLHDRRSYDVLRRLGSGPGLLAAVVLFAALQLGTADVLPSTGHFLYAPFGVVAAMLLIAVVTTRSRSVAVLRSRPAVYVGSLSYALYLVHNFGLNLAEAVVPGAGALPGSLLSTALGIGLSFGVCHLLHKYYEEPLRKLGARLAHSRRPEGTVPALPPARPATAT